MLYLLLFLVVVLVCGCFTVGHHSNAVKFNMQLLDKTHTALPDVLIMVNHTSSGQNTITTNSRGAASFTITQSKTVVGLFYLFRRKVGLKYPVRVPIYFPSLNKNYYLFLFDKRNMRIEVYNQGCYTDTHRAGVWEKQGYQQQKNYRVKYKGKTEVRAVKAKPLIDRPLFWNLHQLHISVQEKNKMYYYQIDVSIQKADFL